MADQVLSGVETGMATPDKRRTGEREWEFLILVQALDTDGVLTKQATFSDLKSATSYVAMRERIEGKRCLVYAIEHNPEIVDTMTYRVELKGRSEDTSPTSQGPEGSGS